jgi:hypothetical protein
MNCLKLKPVTTIILFLSRLKGQPVSMFFFIGLGICFQSNGQELSPISRQELTKLKQQTEEKWNLSKNKTTVKTGAFFLPPDDFKPEKSIYLSGLNPLGFSIFLGNNNAEWEGSQETVSKILFKRCLKEGLEVIIKCSFFKNR